MGSQSRFLMSRGEFYVTDDACTHGPGLLSEGYIDGDLVECNFHNGQFNIRTGEVAAPPCMIPVKTYRVTVDGGKVFIETERDKSQGRGLPAAVTHDGSEFFASV